MNLKNNSIFSPENKAYKNSIMNSPSTMAGYTPNDQRRMNFAELEKMKVTNPGLNSVKKSFNHKPFNF